MKRFVLLLLSVVILVPEVFANGRPLGPQRVLPEEAEMRISNRDITQYVFSPDSTQLAVVCSYSGIWIYDGRTGAELALLAGHTDTITAIKYSPDGKTIATGSLDKTVRLWDAQTFEHRATLEGHLGNTNVLAFSSDSKHLATGASHQVFPERLPRRGFVVLEPSDKESQPEKVIDGRVRLWNVATGELIKTMLTTNSGWVNRLVYASDDISLICVSTDGIYRIWNTETGKDEQFDAKNFYGARHFSPDGTRFVWESKDEKILYDASTGKELTTLEEGPNSISQSVIFSQNGETLITIGPKWSEIRVWNARTGQQHSTIPIDNDGHFVPMALSPDGRMLSIQQDWNKEPIQIWDTKTGNTLSHLSINVRVFSLGFSPNNQTLAMMSYTRSDITHPKDIGYVIRLWDIPSKTETGTIPYMKDSGRSGQPAFVASGKDGMLACGIGDTKIWLFDGNTGKYLKTFLGHTDLVNSVAFSPDGVMLASASNDGTVRLWSTQTNLHLGTLEEQPDPAYGIRQVNAVAFSGDGLTLASVSGFRQFNRSKFHLWSVDTGKHEGTFEEHPNRVSTIAFSPDGVTLATSGSHGDTAIHLWDIRTKKLKTTYIGHANSVTALAFSPDGTLLASGDGTVQLWNTKTGENSSIPTERSWGGVLALVFSPDGTLLAGASGGQIDVWDVGFRQHKATLKGHGQRITSLAFTGDGNTLASASFDQTIVLWKPIATVDKNVVINITPSSVVSLEIGEQLAFKVQIVGGEKVAAFQFTLQYDTSALRYISATNGDYLSDDAIFVKPVIENGQITLTSTALTGEVSGDGTLATVTFEVVDVKTSTVSLHNASISDRGGNRIRPTVKSGKVEIK